MSDPKPYRVTWAIDVEARNPRDAARQARLYAMRTWSCEVTEGPAHVGDPGRDCGTVDLGTIGSPDGETQAEMDRLKIMHYGELFEVAEIYRAGPEQAKSLGCRPGQPILVIN